MSSKFLFNASSKDEEIKIGLDASSKFYFDASSENKEVEVGLNVSYEFLASSELSFYSSFEFPIDASFKFY